MDTFLAIASRREIRDYADRPIPRRDRHDDPRRRPARRAAPATGSRGASSSSRARSRASGSPRRSTSRRTSAARSLVVAIARARRPRRRPVRAEHAARRLERGRRLVPERDQGHRRRRSAALGLDADEEIAIVLTLRLPGASERDPSRRTPEEWSARANRKPLDELVERIDYFRHETLTQYSHRNRMTRAVRGSRFDSSETSIRGGTDMSDPRNADAAALLSGVSSRPHRRPSSAVVPHLCGRRDRPPRSAKPTNTSPPTISRAPQDDKTLTADHGHVVHERHADHVRVRVAALRLGRQQLQHEHRREELDVQGDLEQRRRPSRCSSR